MLLGWKPLESTRTVAESNASSTITVETRVSSSSDWKKYQINTFTYEQCHIEPHKTQNTCTVEPLEYDPLISEISII